MLITSQTRIQPVAGQSSSVLGKETIVLNYTVGNYYELNELGSFIWSLLQTNKVMSVKDIEAGILNEFDVDAAVCQQELTLFLENLVREKLVETIE